MWLKNLLENIETDDKEILDKDYEVAIETALGGSIQNIVTTDEETAKQEIYKAYLKETKVDITETKLTAENLAELIGLIEKGTISNNIGKQILIEDMITNGEKATAVVERKGLSQISDEGAIKAIVEGIINAHPAEVESYRNGKTNLLGFFVGQVMKETKGSANPQMATEILKEELSNK